MGLFDLFRALGLKYPGVSNFAIGQSYKIKCPDCSKTIKSRDEACFGLYCSSKCRKIQLERDKNDNNN